MEEIVLNEKYLIIIINNIKGNIFRLNLILEKISKEIEINYLILTGQVFTLQTKEEDIFSISFKGITIIFDSSPLGEIIKSKYKYNNYNIKNFIFLGKSGIFSPENTSINIAFLGGNEVKEFLEKNSDKSNLSYSNNYYNYKDIENLIDKFTSLKLKSNNKIDFFLINNFPENLYNRYINQIKEECEKNNSKLNEEEINNSISYSLNYLLYIMNPRYVISSVDDFFYKNTKDNIINNFGYRTFFYNLGYLEDKQNINEDFYIALDYKSINDFDEKELLFMESEYEKHIGTKFIKENDLFKFDTQKSLIENFDEYLKICFDENLIKSIRDVVKESKPLFLTNVCYNSTEEEIKNYLIKRYGNIKQLKLLKNRDNNKFNGKVIVQFYDINSMKDMLNNSSKEKFKDRSIKATIYTPKEQLNNSNINNNSNNKNNVTVSNFLSNLNLQNINSFESVKSINNINNNNINNNNINLNNNNINLNNNNTNLNNNSNLFINEEEERKSCWFCYETNPNLDKKFILSEYKYFFLSFSKGPINQYHFLLIPKRHISFYENLTNDEKVECEMIVKILKCFLNSIGYDYIIYEKNLKYNFNKGIHMLVNIIGVEKVYIPKLNEFTENFLIEEKINNYSVSYNEDEDIYLYSSVKNEEYIYINIPKIIKDKIIRKLIFIRSKEYKIDNPRKLICSLINKNERINWRNTLNLGDEFIDELKKEVESFQNDYFSNDKYNNSNNMN